MNFFRNYNRAMALAFAGVVLVLCALFALQLQQRLDEELVVVEGHVDRHVQLMEFVLRSAADQVDALRMAGSGNIEGDRAPRFARLPAGEIAPRDHADRRTFSMDHLVDLDSAGNLVGLGSLAQRPPAFVREVHRALDLTPFMRALVFNLPGAAQTSYLSSQQFQMTSPWVSSAERPFRPAVYDEPVWQLASPQHNPNREKFWPPPYFAGKNTGLLAPVAAPVYDGQNWVGVVRIDLSLDYLNRVNNTFGYGRGSVFLVNENAQVLAHPALYAKAMGMEATPKLSQALPSEVLESELLMQDGAAPRTRLIAGHWVVRRPLVAAPWTLVYTVPRSEVVTALVRERGGMLLGVLVGLGVMLVVTYVVTRRDFVGPAAKLVQHLADASRTEAVAVPRVPDSWKPWFEMVSRVFHESRKLAAVEQELNIAAEMQRNILPTSWPNDARYSLLGVMRSAKQVGGDFYDHFVVDGRLRGVVVADVSGKGVPAALFGMVSKTQMRSVATRLSAATGEVVAQVNNALCENNDSCMFVTGIYTVFDPERGLATLSNFGHPPPLLLGQDGSVRYLPSTPGVSLGLMEGCSYATQELAMQAGDMVFFYTDGVTEAINAANEEWGAQRLLEWLQAARPRSAQEAIACVMQGVDAFVAGVEQSDDITCMVLHWHPEVAATPSIGGEGGA